MPQIDIASAPVREGSSYPSPFNEPCMRRVRKRLGLAGGLTDFGVNLTSLPPGCWSSQRHWHSHEDEFVYILEGELILVEDAGETTLRAGDCAAFPKNTGNGHHLINRSGSSSGVPGDRNARAGRRGDLLGHRHEGRRCRWPVCSQRRLAVSSGRVAGHSERVWLPCGGCLTEERARCPQCCSSSRSSRQPPSE